ncbi:MAG: methyltransferase domain-containing protein [Alphaproteobacteria bacterium]|nr:methyltransferase domain-containing protein [Alphaproteobacteria bacterium]
MLGFYVLLITDVVCIAALIWIWAAIIRLFLDKHYRECPPYVPSFGMEKKIIISRVKEILKKSTRSLTVLDPGCGSGSLIVKLAKEFPEHKFIGVEWGKMAYGIAKIRTSGLKNTEILCCDMFNYDFGNADVIVCFLMDPLMEKFGEKVKKDHKKPQIIFSNSFKIPNLKLSEEITTGRFLMFKNVYVYRVD